MSDNAWSDAVVGERMQVDQEFNEKVAASNFSRQQWGLIMTAVEFEIDDPGDPERARLVANTSKVETIVPELDRMDQARGSAMGGGGLGGGGSGSGGGPGGGGGSGLGGGGSGGSGLFGSIKDALGVGGGGERDREQLAAAEEMAQMYADDLQRKLEDRGRWEEVREMAAATTD